MTQNQLGLNNNSGSRIFGKQINSSMSGKTSFLSWDNFFTYMSPLPVLTKIKSLFRCLLASIWAVYWQAIECVRCFKNQKVTANTQSKIIIHNKYLPVSRSIRSCQSVTIHREFWFSSTKNDIKRLPGSSLVKLDVKPPNPVTSVFPKKSCFSQHFTRGCAIPRFRITTKIKCGYLQRSRRQKSRMDDACSAALLHGKLGRPGAKNTQVPFIKSSQNKRQSSVYLLHSTALVTHQRQINTFSSGK